MLLALSIKNFALISDLYIEFKSGLNIITGETGAGKSIVIDSINFVCGARFTKDIIKKGTQNASVDAVFDLTDDQKSQITGLGIELMDSVVSISRTINDKGKSICRFNDKIITLSLLKQITQNILEIHGQHENQVIFDPSNHVSFLDSYAKDQDVLKNFQKEFFKFKDFRNKVLDEKLDQKSIRYRIETLKSEISEIADLKWEKGLEESLTQKIAEYNNSEKISKALNETYELVYNSNTSLQNNVKGALYQLEPICKLNDKYNHVYKRLENIFYEIEDIGAEIRDQKDKTDYDPNQLDSMQSKLFAFNKLKKKYSLTEDEILELLEDKQKELGELKYNLDNSEEIKKQLKDMFSTAKQQAEILSKVRKEKAMDLAKDVESHLKDLGMKNARFMVNIEAKDMSSKGIDNVEFLFCANAGQDLKPLTKVASGGEISRLMLALKNIDLNSSMVDTMIFDEIDTGISGKMAQAVSNKLANISVRNQVICVTHLPQVAAMSDNHIFVYKKEDKNQTNIFAKELDDKEKLSAIASMFSGEDISDSGLMHAKELVDNSNVYKTKL